MSIVLRKHFWLAVANAVCWSFAIYFAYQLQADGLSVWSNLNILSDLQPVLDMFSLCFLIAVIAFYCTQHRRVYGTLAFIAVSPFLYIWFSYLR